MLRKSERKKYKRARGLKNRIWFNTFGPVKLLLVITYVLYNSLYYEPPENCLKSIYMNNILYLMHNRATGYFFVTNHPLNYINSNIIGLVRVKKEYLFGARYSLKRIKTYL